MKRIFSIILILLLSIPLIAKDVKVYRGSSQSSNDILYTIHNSKVYRGDSIKAEDVIFTVSGNYIYIGARADSDKIVYTASGGVIYAGNEINRHNIEYSFRSTRIYRKDSVFGTDILANIWNDYVYYGMNKGKECAIYHFSSLVEFPMQAAIWLAYKKQY